MKVKARMGLGGATRVWFCWVLTPQELRSLEERAKDSAQVYTSSPVFKSEELWYLQLSGQFTPEKKGEKPCCFPPWKQKIFFKQRLAFEEY